MPQLVILKTNATLPATAPEWWRLIPAGEVFILGSPDPIRMDEEAAASVIRNFEHMGRDLVIDYEHQTLKDMEAPAAGWIKAFEWRPDGLWIKTEWTDKASAYIAAKEYRYCSPVLAHRQTDGRVAAIFSVALTNSPKTRNIDPIVAKLNNPVTEDPMKKLKALLGLKEDATPEAIEAAVVALKTKNEELASALEARATTIACKSVMTALGLSEDAAEAVVVAKIESLSATAPAASDLARQVVDLSAEVTRMKAEALTVEALKNGQTSPDELAKWGKDLAAKDPETFKTIVCSRPHGSVVPVGRVTTVEPETGPTDDAVLAVAKMMGVTPDDIKTFGMRGEA